VFTQPQAIATAATDVAGIGSAIREANAAAATSSTTSVVAAAQDEVSAGISALFGSHGQEYEALSGHVAAFHERFVQLMNAGAGSYAGAEAANASPLRDLLSNPAFAGLLNADNRSRFIPNFGRAQSRFIPASVRRSSPRPGFIELLNSKIESLGRYEGAG
jgi:hypothetical protein